MNKTISKILNHVPTVYSSEEKTVLGLVKEIQNGTNEIIDFSNELSEEVTKKVSHEQLKNTYKLDETSNFTGKWHGITRPEFSDPGIANVVIQHSEQIKDIDLKTPNSPVDYKQYQTEEDDWEMLQKLIDNTKQTSSQIGGYVTTGYSEKIVFPTGDYKISKPLIIPHAYTNIDFGGSRIKPTSTFDKTKFGLDFTYIWNGNFSNLVLDGFDNHIRLANPNSDSGNIKIDNVSIYGGKVGYDITCRSTKTTITNFKFNNVKKCAVVHHADKLTFRSGWLDAGVLDNVYDGMFEIDNYCQLVIDDMIYVPRPQAKEKVYIFKLINGDITIQNSLFGGEPGQISIVGLFGGTVPGRGNNVSLINTKIFISTENTAWVELYNIPNKVIFNGVFGGTEPQGKYRYIKYNEDLVSLASAIAQSNGIPCIHFSNMVDIVPLGYFQKDLFPFIKIGTKSFGVVKATNTVFSEIKFGSKQNNVDFWSCRLGATYKICITNRENCGADRYGEFIVASDFSGNSATVKAIVQGESTVAPVVFVNNNIVKVKTNGAVTENTFFYSIEQIDVPFLPNSL